MHPCKSNPMHIAIALLILSSSLSGCTDAGVQDNLPGCTSPDAVNYDENATTDDNSCTFDSDGDGVLDHLEVDGCIDVFANNHDPLATDDDGSCDYDLDDDGILDEDEVGGCTDSTANNHDPLATDDDGSCDYAFGTWGSVQMGLSNRNLIIGDTIYTVGDDLWSYNSESGFTIHPVQGIQFAYPHQIVELSGVLYFSAEEVIGGSRTSEYATFAHDLSNSTTWRIPDNSHLSNFRWGFTYDGDDFFLTNDNAVRVFTDDGNSIEVYNHTIGTWCEFCGEVGITDHGLVFLASDGEDTGNHMEFWLLDLDDINVSQSDPVSASAIQLTDLDLSDNYGTMWIDVLSITDEAVIFATPESGFSSDNYLWQYSFSNETVWQVHPDTVNLWEHRELQGYDASDKEVIIIPEQDGSAASVLIYNSSSGSVFEHQFGSTSQIPLSYISDGELILSYRPLSSTNEVTPISEVVGISLINGSMRNITSFDQSDLLNSDTEYPAEQNGVDGDIASFGNYIFLRSRGQLLVHDTVNGTNWVNHNLSMTIEVRHFQCDNGEQILFYLVNDGVEDCSDGSDEVDWDDSDSPGWPGTFTCDDGVEISFFWVNDWQHDCSNGEDEWYPPGFHAMRNGWDLFVLGDSILFRLGWDIWYQQL